MAVVLDRAVLEAFMCSCVICYSFMSQQCPGWLLLTWSRRDLWEMLRFDKGIMGWDASGLFETGLNVKPVASVLWLLQRPLGFWRTVCSNELWNEEHAVEPQRCGILCGKGLTHQPWIFKPCIFHRSSILVFDKFLGDNLWVHGISCLKKMPLYIWGFGPLQIVYINNVIYGGGFCLPGAMIIDKVWLLRDWRLK